MLLSNDGVAACVKQNDGGVGYVEQAYALQNKFNTAAVKNKSGAYVEPTLGSTSAAADGETVCIEVDRHDITVTQPYWASLPDEVRRHLDARAVDRLEPVVQQHDIEGLIMGAAQD